MEKVFNSEQHADYQLSQRKQPVVMELALKEKSHLKMHEEELPELSGYVFPEGRTKKQSVKNYGKYRVKETFAGEESLTNLLTQYVERTVALRY